MEKKHKYYRDYKKPEEKKEDVTPVEEAKDKGIKKKVRTRTKLNIRSTPEISDNVIGELENGSIVTVLNEKDDWSNITEGYVMSKFLTNIK